MSYKYYFFHGNLVIARTGCTKSKVYKSLKISSNTLNKAFGEGLQLSTVSKIFNYINENFYNKKLNSADFIYQKGKKTTLNESYVMAIVDKIL